MPRSYTNFERFLMNRMRFPDHSKIPERVILLCRTRNVVTVEHENVVWKTFDSGYTWEFVSFVEDLTYDSDLD